MFNSMRKIVFEREFSRPFVIVFCLTLFVLFGVIDYLSKTEISFTLFYLIPVLIVSWYIGRKTGILFSFLCAFLWFMQEIIGGQFYSDPFLVYWNTIVKTAIYLITSLIVSQLKYVFKSEQSNLLMLGESNKKYRNLFNNASACYQELDIEGKIVQVNQTEADMLGYTIDEMIGKSVFDLVSPDQLETEKIRYKEKIRKKLAPANFERKYIAKNGDEIYFSIADTLVFNENGDITGIRSTLQNITDRKRVEEAIEYERILLRTIIDNIPMAVYAKDGDGHKVLANSVDLTYVNKPENEVIGHTDMELLPTDVAERTMADDFSVIRNGERLIDREELLINNAGERRWLLTSKIPWRNMEGNIIGLVGIGHDITERKHTEEELEHSRDIQTVLNKMLRLSLEDLSINKFLEQSLDLILSIPWFSFESRGAIFLVENEPDILVLKAQKGLSEPIQRACSRVSFGKCLCGRAAAEQRTIFSDHLDEHHEITYEGIYSHGHYCVPILAAGKTIGVINVYLKEGRDYNSQEEKFLLAIADTLVLTIQSKQAEKALHSLSLHQQTLLTAIKDIVAEVDLDKKYTWVNKAGTEFFGEDVIGKEASFYFEGEQDTYSIAQPIFEGEKDSVYIESWQRRKDGENRLLAWWCTALKDNQGNIIGSLSTAHDITERRRSEEAQEKLKDRLLQSQKMEAIGTLAGGIAHDFNNILSGIMGYTELSMDQVSEKTQLHSDLEKILKSSNRAKELVNQILTFSRQSEQEKRPIKIEPIIKETLKFLHASLPSNIDIRQNIESELGSVLADPIQIHQVFVNLCTNAGHAMHDKGGILEVSLTNVELDSDFILNHPNINPGKYLKLTISDTGYGMEKEALDRIFEPYFTTKNKTGGTGLGLAVVHGIVTSYGGTITAYSEQGKGTTFKIYLPVIEGENGKLVEKAKSVSKGHERILLIDDEPDIIDVGKRILESLGYKVVSSINSIKALELFQKNPDQFDLVITDMTMPFMTGDELATELMHIRADIPVILCTGYSEKITKENYFFILLKIFGRRLIISSLKFWIE